MASLSGSAGQHVLRLAGDGVGVAAGPGHRRVGAQQPQRLVEPGVVAEVAGEQRLEPGVGRVVGGEDVEHREGALALAQVGARRLAGLVGLATRCR